MHTNYKNIFFTLLTVPASYTLPAQEINTASVSFKDSHISSMRVTRKNENTQKVEKKSSKIITQMNYEELIQTKERYKNNKNRDGYIKVLELILKLTTDTSALAEHMLELAQAYYQQEEYKKASLIYNEFILFYKGHEKIEFAHFQAIKSLEQLLLPADRDQTRTEEILGIIESYLAMQEFTQYRDQIITLQKKCHLLLFESKKNTCQFYITYNNVTAAGISIRRLRDEWIDLLPEVEKDIVILEIALAEKSNNSALLAEKKDLLATKFPEQTVIIAKNTHTRVMQNRF